MFETFNLPGSKTSEAKKYELLLQQKLFNFISKKAPSLLCEYRWI